MVNIVTDGRNVVTSGTCEEVGESAKSESMNAQRIEFVKNELLNAQELNS